MSYVHKRARARRRGQRALPMGDDVGAVAVAPGSSIAPEQNDWQQQMLATTQNQLAFMQQQDARDRNQKWIAIAVTASIPLFGAIWKAILGRRRARMSL